MSLKLRIALRLLGLWRERPMGVRRIERALKDDLDGVHDIDVRAANADIDQLEEVRRAGPFVGMVDRTLLLSPHDG